MVTRETIFFDGIPFHRYPQSKYRANRVVFNPFRKYKKIGIPALHVYIYEKHYGIKVPKGFHIHHKDENPLNNDVDNLYMISKRDHRSLHMKEFHKKNPVISKENAQRAGDIFRKSVNTKEWYSENSKRIWDKHSKAGYNSCKNCKTMFSYRTISSVPDFCSKKCKDNYKYE